MSSLLGLMVVRLVPSLSQIKLANIRFLFSDKLLHITVLIFLCIQRRNLLQCNNDGLSID